MGKEAVGLCHSCRRLLIKCRRDLTAGHVIVAVLHPRHGDGDCLSAFQAAGTSHPEKRVSHNNKSLCPHPSNLRPRHPGSCCQFFQCHAVGFRASASVPLLPHHIYLQGDTVLRQNDQILQPGCRCVEPLSCNPPPVGHLCTPLLQTCRMLNLRCAASPSFCSTVRRLASSRGSAAGTSAGHRRFLPASTACICVPPHPAAAWHQPKQQQSPFAPQRILPAYRIMCFPGL